MNTCNVCHVDFQILEEDRAFYAGMDAPEPKQCPECRLIRRLLERNARKLYKRTCDFSGKTILSTFHEQQPFPVYHHDIWWGDGWDAMDHGRDFDFSRPFSEQFLELKSVVPHFSVFVVGGTLENSEYTNCTGYLKNCYLIFESDYDEDCAYSNRIYHCKNLLDCTNCHESELCYDCVDCQKSYGLVSSQECIQCQDSYFLKSCTACQDCIGCVNQRHKRYMIFNQQYSPEEYVAEKARLHLDTREGLEAVRARAEALFRTQPHKATEGEQNENVVGDHVYHSKNVYQAFDANDLEDCRYCAKVTSQVKNCMDYTSWGFKAEQVYQCASCGDNAYNLKFCSTCTTNISNLEYCMYCTGSSDCFGCVGLKKKRFCIFNKQYSPEDYQVLRGRLIEYMKTTGEWGEFFPISICSYGYNETLAQDQFPKTREEALALGYGWSDYEMPESDMGRGMPGVVECVSSGKLFRLTPMELAFYERMKLPAPVKHPDVRHVERTGRRPMWRLREVACSSCGKVVPGNMGRDSDETAVCVECYLKLVY